MAKKCSNTNDLYANVEFCPGEATMPGMRPYFFFQKKTISSHGLSCQ